MVVPSDIKVYESMGAVRKEQRGAELPVSGERGSQRFLPAPSLFQLLWVSAPAPQRLLQLLWVPLLPLHPSPQVCPSLEYFHCWCAHPPPQLLPPPLGCSNPAWPVPHLGRVLFPVDLRRWGGAHQWAVLVLRCSHKWGEPGGELPDVAALPDWLRPMGQLVQSPSSDRGQHQTLQGKVQKNSAVGRCEIICPTLAISPSSLIQSSLSPEA